MRRWQTQVKAAFAALLCIAASTATLSPAPAEAADTSAYISFAAPLAQREYTQFRVPASVAIAQSILESGWGGSGLTTEAKNYFGIKCPSSGFASNTGSPYVTGCVAKDSYEYPGPVLIRSYFRTYASAQDSFYDHGRLLSTRSWYATAFAYSSDPDQFIREVAKGGYATDPTYADLVISLMKRYNLYRFDPVRVSATPTPTAPATLMATTSATPTRPATQSPAPAPTTAAPTTVAPTPASTSVAPLTPVRTSAAAPPARPTPTQATSRPTLASTSPRPLATTSVPRTATSSTAPTRTPSATPELTATLSASPAAVAATVTAVPPISAVVVREHRIDRIWSRLDPPYASRTHWVAWLH